MKKYSIAGLSGILLLGLVAVALANFESTEPAYASNGIQNQIQASQNQAGEHNNVVNQNKKAKKQKHMKNKVHVTPTATSTTSEEVISNAVLETVLTYLVQEEKVAYDLYTVIGADTGLRQMANISQSEARHIDAVRNLLATYGISDPTQGLAVGEFTDPALQVLYDELLASGTDIAGAKDVGLAVEETDIADILKILEQDLPAAVQAVLNNLLNGSYNHLAAFSR